MSKLRRRHPYLFAAVTTVLVFALCIGIDYAKNGSVDQPLVSTTVALGWLAGIVAATYKGWRRPPRTGQRVGMNRYGNGNAGGMTSDSDDVADSANKKPRGSLPNVPTAAMPKATEPAASQQHGGEPHRTGEQQAAENRGDESPS